MKQNRPLRVQVIDDASSPSKNPQEPVPDLLTDYIRLPDLANHLPESYELIRLRTEDRIPAERAEDGRIFVDRAFALNLVAARERLDTFNDALQTATAMNDTDSAGDGVSTSVSSISEKWSISEHRIRDAAKNLKSVSIALGKIETTKAGLIDLRRRLSAQTA